MAEEKKNPDASFRTRLKSALILAPLVLAVIYVGGVPFALMMAAAAGIAAHEWGGMALQHVPAPAQAGVQTQHMDPGFRRDGKKGVILLSSLFTSLSAASAAMFYSPLPALCFLLALCFLIFAMNVTQGGPSLKYLIPGIVYIGFSIAVMIWLRGGQSAQGLFYFSTLVVLVWASDICAYFTGKAIGGPKLAPKISPKKTWAGFIGSSVGAAVAAAGMTCPVLTRAMDVDTLGDMPWQGYAVMGFILAMVGQAGDLGVSVFKRKFNVKDTGALIPGHGGILDRIDALMLVAIVYGALVAVLA